MSCEINRKTANNIVIFSSKDKYNSFDNKHIDIYIAHDLSLGYKSEIGQYVRSSNKLFLFSKIEIITNRLVVNVDSGLMLELIKSRRGEIIYNIYSVRYSRSQYIGIISKKAKKQFKKISEYASEFQHDAQGLIDISDFIIAK
jgi:hypothetical protein